MRVWVDALGEALPVDADQAGRAGHDGRWAPIVGGQQHAVGTRIGRAEVQNPTDVGEAPGVDGLVVVSDHE